MAAPQIVDKARFPLGLHGESAFYIFHPQRRCEGQCPDYMISSSLLGASSASVLRALDTTRGWLSGPCGTPSA